MYQIYLNLNNKIVLVKTNSKVVFNHINSLTLPEGNEESDFTITFLKNNKKNYDLNIEKKELVISEPNIEDIRGGYKYYNTLKWLMRILNIVFYPNAFSFHAASFSYNNKGFLASSVGLAGKSTFAVLSSMNGGEYINDEYSFVKFKNDVPYVFGYPEMGAHIRIGTKKVLNLDYSDDLRVKYNPYSKEEISKLEADDSKIDVKKIGKTTRCHKLDYVLLLNMNLKREFFIQKISKEKARPILRFSLLKHIFKLLDFEDEFYRIKNSSMVINELEKRFKFSSSIIDSFIEKLLDHVDCYEVENNLKIKNILACLDSLTN